MTTYKYFVNCTTVEQVKKLYRKLAFTHHPDRGGDVRIMQEINAEYDLIMKSFDGTTTGQNGENYAADSELFKKIINVIVTFDIRIEIIGSWIWCFDCYAYKDDLKALGFRWIAKRKAWAWHDPRQKYGKSKRGLNYIRKKYGCTEVKTNTKQAVTV